VFSDVPKRILFVVRSWRNLSSFKIFLPKIFDEVVTISKLLNVPEVSVPDLSIVHLDLDHLLLFVALSLLGL
jgi:hypothetical protein